MIERRVSRKTTGGVFFQHAGQQVEGAGRKRAVDLFVEVELARPVLRQDLIVLLALEN